MDGTDGARASWGRSESRSGYFGESWGDYLINLSIALRGFWESTCVRHSIFFFFFFGYCLPFSVKVICGWCFLVVGCKGLWLNLCRDLPVLCFSAFVGVSTSMYAVRQDSPGHILCYFLGSLSVTGFGVLRAYILLPYG